jgi:hypothetical protein
MKLSQSQSQSYFATDSQSVSQYVLVSSPIWDFWPEIISFSFLKITVLSFGGALSDERSGLSFVSLQSVYSSQSVYTQNIYILCYIQLYLSWISTTILLSQQCFSVFRRIVVLIHCYLLRTKNCCTYSLLLRNRNLQKKKKKKISCQKSQIGLDTKTYWLTDCQL